MPRRVVYATTRKVHMTYSKEFWDTYHKQSGGEESKKRHKRLILGGLVAGLVATASIASCSDNEQPTPTTAQTTTTIESTTTTSTTTTTAPETTVPPTIPVETFSFESSGKKIECEVSTEPHIVVRGESISKIVRQAQGENEGVSTIIAGVIDYNQAKGTIDNPSLIFEGMQIYLLNNCAAQPSMPDTL